jgi:hypothetical protein
MKRRLSCGLEHSLSMLIYCLTRARNSQAPDSRLKRRNMGGKWEEEAPLSVTLQGLYRAIGVAETRAHAPPEPVETNYKRLIGKSP